VTQLVFSPDSKRLVSADGGGIVRGWRFELSSRNTLLTSTDSSVCLPTVQTADHGPWS
jgi:hypothetical protein